MATSYATEVELDNPLVWWRLGESSGTTANDNSPGTGDYDGTYSGSPTLGVVDSPLTPSDGTSVTFDGSNDYVSVASVPIGTHYGVECWVRPTNISATRTLVNLYAASYSPLTVKVDTSGNVLVSMHDGSALTFAAGVTAGAWHHLFVQVERTESGSPASAVSVSVWINGAMVGSAQADSVLTTTEVGLVTLNLARHQSDGEYFAGTVKELAFYTDSLIGTAAVGRPLAHYTAATSTTEAVVLALKVKINGTDRTANVDAYSVQIVEALNAGPATAEFTLMGVTPTMDHAVLIGSDGYSGADLLFAGSICGFTRQLAKKNQRTVYRVRARGKGYQPKLVRESYTEQTPMDVLHDLVITKDYDVNTLGVGEAPNSDKGSWTFINKPLSECFDELAKWVSGYWFVRVDDGVSIITSGQTPGVTLSASTTHWRNLIYDTAGEPIRDYVMAEGYATRILSAITSENYVPVADASGFSTSGGARIGTTLVAPTLTVDYSRDTTTTSNDENAGATTIEVASTTGFASYGWCYIAGVLYKYQVGSGAIMLGFPGLVADTKSGALVQEADWIYSSTAITAAAGLGVAQYATAGTGDNEYLVNAGSDVTYAALDAIADSELRTAARVSGSFTSDDDNARVGRKVTISMSSEWGISGTYIAERVEISYERGRSRPQFHVSFGSVSVTQDLYAILRRLLAGQ
jgi:uncharacterized protein YaiE (UPF0345 family)